mmetsp:Transcript_50838/g.110000  ORF Transcript_50838/g.110000 Transcript_50838/m.110000 type:complete len:478 (-) Transcript_50838:93-1526(-)
MSQEEKQLIIEKAKFLVGYSSGISREAKVSEFCRDFLQASSEVRNDREVALAAISVSGRLLRDCSEALRDDETVAFAAVCRDPAALKFFSERLRGCKALVLRAVQMHGTALAHASEDLKDDLDIVLEAVKAQGAALKHASQKLQGDREIVLAAVNNSHWALAFASEALRADREVVLAALRGQKLQKNMGPSALMFASQELRSDRDLVLEALRTSPKGLHHFEAPQLKRDKAEVAFSEDFQSAANSCLAGRGESAPVLTISIKKFPSGHECISSEDGSSSDRSSSSSSSTTSTRDNKNSSDQHGTAVDDDLFRCEARLLSGSGFAFSFRSRWEPSAAGSTVDSNGDGNSDSSSSSNSNSDCGDDSDGGNEGDQPRPKRARVASPYRKVGGSGHKSFDFTSKLSLTTGRAEAVTAGTKLPNSNLNLNHLAQRLVLEVCKHGQVECPDRVFVVFETRDGESISMTPWDWWRPLTDFLVAS